MSSQYSAGSYSLYGGIGTDLGIVGLVRTHPSILFVEWETKSEIRTEESEQLEIQEKTSTGLVVRLSINFSLNHAYQDRQNTHQSSDGSGSLQEFRGIIPYD